MIQYPKIFTVGEYILPVADTTSRRSDMKEMVEIDLKALFQEVMKRIWIVILCAAIAVGAALTYTACFVTPTYKASIKVYVNNKTNNNTGGVASSDLSVALKLVNTYVNILESDNVLEKVVAQSGYDLELKQLRDMIDAQPVDDTEMFTVSVVCEDPEMAAQIANAVAAVAPSAISDIIEGSSAKIIDYAKVPDGRFSPSYTKTAILSFLAGALLAVVVIVLNSVLDKRVKGEEELVRLCDMPVLGMIPDITFEKKRSRQQRSDMDR